MPIFFKTACGGQAKCPDARMCLGTPIRPHMKPGMPLDMLSAASPRRRPSTCSTYDALFWTVHRQCLYSVNTKLPPMQCLSSEQSSPKLRFAYKPLTASTLDFLVALPSCTEAKVQKRNSCHIWRHTEIFLFTHCKLYSCKSVNLKQRRVWCGVVLAHYKPGRSVHQSKPNTVQGGQIQYW